MRLLARILVVVMALNGGALRAAPAATKDGAKPAAAKKTAPTTKKAPTPPPPDQPAPSAAAPATGGASENLGSYEVTGQAKDKVLIEKSSPEIKLDVKEVVDSVTDKTEQLLERPRTIPDQEDYDHFDRLTSNQTARPWLPDLAEPPLISFQPAPPKTTVTGWRLEVTNDLGEVIKIISGKGNPVKEIVWDGIDAKGQMIRVAAAYSFRFITIDEFQNTHTTLGKAFTLRHLKYQDKRNVIVEISSKFLFKDEKISIDAVPILERTLDVLREYSTYLFSLEFQTEAPQGDPIKERQRRLTDKITKDLQLPPDSVKYTYSPIKDRGEVTRFVIRLR